MNTIVSNSVTQTQKSVSALKKMSCLGNNRRNAEKKAYNHHHKELANLLIALNEVEEIESGKRAAISFEQFIELL